MTTAPRRPAGSKRDGALAFLIVSSIITLVSYFVPYGRYVAWPLILLSTWAHEMGHGMAALLVGADFESFRMWADGSGVAQWRGVVGRFGRGFIAAGGLIGPSVLAAIGFALGRRERTARVGIGVFGLIMLAAALLVVRNAFGLAFTGILGAVCVLLASKARPWLAHVATVFLSVQLALSVFSRGDYLFTDVAHTANGPMPSDVAQMADALFLPYWMWGGLCGAVSIAVLGFGLQLFFRAQSTQT